MTSSDQAPTELFDLDQVPVSVDTSKKSKKKRIRYATEEEAAEREEKKRDRKEKKRRKNADDDSTVIENVEGVQEQNNNDDIELESVEAPNDVTQSDESNGGASKNQKDRGIWVGNLSFATTEGALREFFAECGKITRCKLPMSKPRENKGFAYIDFETEDGANAAVAKSETMLEGRTLLIKKSKDFTFTGRPKREADEAVGDAENNEDQNKFASNTNSKIFIGNLGFECTKEMVSEAFKQFGDFVEVRVASFEDSGRCKGFAHIIYKTPQSAADAVQYCRKKRLYVGKNVARVDFSSGVPKLKAEKRQQRDQRRDERGRRAQQPHRKSQGSHLDEETPLPAFEGRKTVFGDEE